jgi:hypothetical protein
MPPVVDAAGAGFPGDSLSAGGAAMSATSEDATLMAFDALACEMLGTARARPWDAMALDDSSGGLSHGEKQAIGFMLRVWSPSEKWKTKFDLHEAVSVWDPRRRAAAIRWIEKPFWP